MIDANELRHELRQYTGGEQVYKHSLVSTFNYTAGMRFMFQNAGNGAYWLADILATEPKIKQAVLAEGFCVGVLKVSGAAAMLAVARDYNEHADEGNKLDGVGFARAIHSTDFPEGTWKFYLVGTLVGGREVILAMLPNEY